MVFIRSVTDRALTFGLQTELRRRGVACHEREPSASWSPAPNDVPVLVQPDSKGGPHRHRRLAELAKGCLDVGVEPVLLVHAKQDVPASLVGKVRAVLRVDLADGHVDRLFRELFGVLLEPLPPWLECWTVPSLMSAPTGVSWWTDDLLVADERHGHILVIGVDGARPILPGLDDPHHIHLDRNRLLVANRSADEVLLAELRGGAAGNIDVIRQAAKQPLRHPNGVHQSHGRTLVADTDNHRVLFSDSDPFDQRPRWKALYGAGRMQYPCGVCGDRDRLWVADTFNHRVLGFDVSGELTVCHGAYGWDAGQFAYPVGLVRWRDYLLVADEEPRRVQVFRVTRRDSHTQLLRIPEADMLGSPWITRPFAMSVNAHGRLAISDRTRRCVWVIDLRAALAELEAHDAA